MGSLNAYNGQGNLVEDPKLFQSEKGNVVRFTIAINNGFGERRTTTFLDCVAFGKQADTIAKHFKKGREILVSGSLEMDRWETKDGDKRSKLQLRLSNYDGWFFTSGGPRGEAEESPPEEAPAATGGDNLF